MFIETSSMPHSEPTRRFYVKQGYAVTGVLFDFYSDGDHMVVFRKRLEGEDRARPDLPAAAAQLGS